MAEREPPRAVPADPLDRLRAQARLAGAGVRPPAAQASPPPPREPRPETAGGAVPPQGYQVPGARPRPHPEAQVLAALADLLRVAVSPALVHQAADLLRDLLLALRALIDWYLEKLERSRPAPRRVEDIPLD